MMSVTKLKMKLMNKSGIYPAGNRVLVFVDQIKEKTEGTLIELLDETEEAMQCGNASGTMVAAGPDAFQHKTEWVYHLHDNSQEELVEKRVSGYAEPFAKPGDRISFAKYAGQKYKGKDNERYLVMNDTDITCRLDSEVELTDLDIRKGAGLS